MADHTGHRWAVDGIEEGIARIEEDGERILTVPVTLLPVGTTEGQLLRALRAPSGRILQVELDLAATQTARRASTAAIDAAMVESKKRDPGGDVAL